MNDKQYQTIATLLERLSKSDAMSVYGDWIRSTFPSELVTIISGLTHNDLRILDNLSQQDLSVSQIVARVDLSQGGISRRVNVMSKKGIVKKYQNDKNKKTVYLKLTPIGQELASAHHKLHNHIKENFFKKTERFHEDEIEIVISFLTAILTK
ncbi:MULTISPECIES: MarR family winged helix-turn-helix transcriptional regulator [Lactobacillaceae]|uniref:MarR family transcriptional regulator n=1 Tax=Oenococcus kitaharae DSM 17330 TaxID=1045004 RepID=G9WHQ1_9LACO|nr:MarR family transcriptional regulator [Oenococcus kitaharae]EHN58625.1 MarR family transcriptional regulator [Oenococcus kitaharae DSM 17330]OEY85509.1 ArsR family transcriptional regulator [Oenococcus kitaharae]